MTPSHLKSAGRGEKSDCGQAQNAKAPVGSTGAEDRRQAARKRWWRRIKWSVRIAGLLFMIGYLKFVGLDGKFYYPDREVYASPQELGVPCEDVTFATRDGVRLHGWFLPAQGRAKGIVVHFHGNAANVTAHLSLVEWLPRACYHVLMFDYRGYGQSAGKVTRTGTIRDGHAALDYALSRPEAHALPLFAYGQSLGGAVAIVVAVERPEVRAVVAESTFSSYRRIAARHVRRLVHFDWFARFLALVSISGGFDPIDVVGRLSPRPLLVVAAERDQICFPELARELYEAAGEPKSFWLAPRAEHLSILEENADELTHRVAAFLEQAGAKKP